jgi:hypothetical protein
MRSAAHRVSLALASRFCAASFSLHLQSDDDVPRRRGIEDQGVNNFDRIVFDVTATGNTPGSSKAFHELSLPGV